MDELNQAFEMVYSRSVTKQTPHLGFLLCALISLLSHFSAVLSMLSFLCSHFSALLSTSFSLDLPAYSRLSVCGSFLSFYLSVSLSFSLHLAHFFFFTTAFFLSTTAGMAISTGLPSSSVKSLRRTSRPSP